MSISDITPAKVALKKIQRDKGLEFKEEHRNKLSELKYLLEKHEPGVDREMELFKWKHANWPPQKIFSTAHGGDCAEHVLQVINNRLYWPDTAIIDGKHVVLEYERNFNEFVAWLLA